MGTPNFDEGANVPVTMLSCGICNASKKITQCAEHEETLTGEFVYRLYYTCPNCGDELGGAVLKASEL